MKMTLPYKVDIKEAIFFRLPQYSFLGFHPPMQKIRLKNLQKFVTLIPNQKSIFYTVVFINLVDNKGPLTGVYVFDPTGVGLKPT